MGFPGGRGKLQNTLKNLDIIEFSDLHVFPYSDREKTLAAKFEGK